MDEATESELRQINHSANEGNLDAHRSRDTGEESSQNHCLSQVQKTFDEGRQQSQPLSNREEVQHNGMPTISSDCLSLKPSAKEAELDAAQRPEKHRLGADEKHHLDARFPATKKCKTERESNSHPKTVESDELHSETSCEAMDIETTDGGIPEASVPAVPIIRQQIQLLEPPALSEPDIVERTHQVDHNPQGEQLEGRLTDVPSSTEVASAEPNSYQQVPNTHSNVSLSLSSPAWSTATDPSANLPQKSLGSPSRYQNEETTESQISALRSSTVDHQHSLSDLSSIHHTKLEIPNSSVNCQTSPSEDIPVTLAGVVPVLQSSIIRSCDPPPTPEVQDLAELPAALMTVLKASFHTKESIISSESCASQTAQVCVTESAENPSLPNVQAITPLQGARTRSQCAEQSKSKQNTVTSQKQHSVPAPETPVKTIKSLKKSARTKQSIPDPASATSVTGPPSKLPKKAHFVNLTDDDAPKKGTNIEQVALKSKSASIQLDKAQAITSQPTKAQNHETTETEADTEASNESLSDEISAAKKKRATPAKIQNASAGSVPARRPAIVLEPVEPYADSFPHFVSGDVQIQICNSNPRYNYRLHQAILKSASQWFRNAMQQTVVEEDQILAARLEQGINLPLKFVLDFSVNEKFGSLRRVCFTRPPVEKKSSGKQNAKLNNRSRVEARQAAIIPQEQNDVCHTDQQEEVFEAYNNLFKSYYYLAPKIDRRDINKAFRQIELLREIAQTYESFHTVKSCLKNVLLQFGRGLYRDILHNPPRWLPLLIQLKSGLLFREAMVHIVGNHQRWQADTIDRPDFPPDLQTLIARKISDLKTLKIEIDTQLFTSGICVDGKELMLNKCDPTSYNTWIVANCWNNWYSQSLVKAIANKESCVDGVMYRQMARGGDAYLHPASVVASVMKLREQDFKPTDEPEIEEDLTIMKNFAQRMVQRLCVNHSMLSVEEEDITYFTCSTIETSELPWFSRKNASL